MTTPETHPVGTADLVKRLRDYEEYEQSRDGQIICVKSDIAQEAADRLEQLEAALTRANAATAAAYEVAAGRVGKMAEDALTHEAHEHATQCEEEIRALATPDQTAALDRLIAEAVKPYRSVLRDIIDHADEISSPLVEAQLLLTASKKGGA